ncbi:MAG: lyase family protein [Beijerinckiaceae bacterium]
MPKQRPDMSPFTSSGLTGALFADAEMAEILSDRRWLEAMLDFEAALARAEAEVGVIPKEAAEAIASCCDVDLYDIAEIGRRTTLAGNPAISLVAMLTEKVREKDAAAAEFVHYGATSQDVIDTGLGRVLLDGRNRVFERLLQINRKLADLARAHRHTIMVSRTLLQHALPTSFGLKCANWLNPLSELEWTIFTHRPRAQLGGANGALAALEDRGIEVIEAMQRVCIEEPDARFFRLINSLSVPTHTARVSLQTLAGDFGMLCSVLGKIARDITLLMQTEVAEVFEPSAPGKGGSSTLPHKRNPVQSVAIIAIATRTPGLVATMLSAGLQEHERGVGGWHAEWDTMRELLLLTGAAALHMQTMLEGLEVDTDRMRSNLELTNGLIMAERVTFALAPSLGKANAKSLVEVACKRATNSKRHLRDVLSEMPEGLELDLDALFDPATYLGSSFVFIDMILKEHARQHDHFDGVLV